MNFYKDRKTILADSVKNTKTKYISSLKEIIPMEKRTNVIMIATCECGNKKMIELTRFNETGDELANRVLMGKGRCTLNIHIFKKRRFKSGMAFRGQNTFYLKYLNHKYKKYLIHPTMNLPYNSLARLI